MYICIYIYIYIYIYISCLNFNMRDLEYIDMGPMCLIYSGKRKNYFTFR